MGEVAISCLARTPGSPRAWDSRLWSQSQGWLGLIAALIWPDLVGLTTPSFWKMWPSALLRPLSPGVGPQRQFYPLAHHLGMLFQAPTQIQFSEISVSTWSPSGISDSPGRICSRPSPGVAIGPGPCCPSPSHCHSLSPPPKSCQFEFLTLPLPPP